MKFNKEWHQANRMPEKPTPQQRIQWHIAHAQHCHCRPMPESIKAEIKKRSKNKLS
ncbi:hypothetical protein [Ferruginibacter sp. SUN106]|uniref:hypothetical protein n=1 Tax=Ferruginibacter sp. SUN106 TaxID=2978348 RepID=UPI003D36B280